MTTPRRILIIAGEISGDMHAARLVQAIRASQPDWTFFGVGGDHMAAEGVDLQYHVRDTAVVGFVEVIKHFTFFRRMFYSLLQEARETKPDAVILVDYPGFNLRFAKQAHKLGLRVIYYICPQVWAWNRSRIAEMAKTVDHLITIFPFEAEHFKNSGLPVDFAGHPLVETTATALAAPVTPLPWQGSPKIALLPGSRRSEIDRIFPVQWQAAGELQKKLPNASFLIAAPNKEIAAREERMIRQLPAGPRNYAIVADQTREILRQATAALVASGTATVETALMGCPMLVVYRMAPLTYYLARLLVRIPYIGMVNIIAGREICPEFIQHKATPITLSSALLPLLSDTPQRHEMKEQLSKVRQLLDTGPVEPKAAQWIIKDVETKQKI